MYPERRGQICERINEREENPLISPCESPLALKSSLELHLQNKVTNMSSPLAFQGPKNGKMGGAFTWKFYRHGALGSPRDGGEPDTFLIAGTKHMTKAAVLVRAL